MYRLITERALPELLTLSQEFESVGDRASQLNSLDVALSVPPVFNESTTITALKAYLLSVKNYTTLVEALAFNLNVKDGNVRVSVTIFNTHSILLIRIFSAITWT